MKQAPGEYILTPVLKTLPVEYGLYQRHIQVLQHEQQLAPVEFRLGRIKKIELSPGELFANSDEVLNVEAYAYDDQGQYLFAGAEISVDGGAEVTGRSENGVRLKIKKGDETVTASLYAKSNSLLGLTLSAYRGGFHRPN